MSNKNIQEGKVLLQISKLKSEEDALTALAWVYDSHSNNSNKVNFWLACKQERSSKWNGPDINLDECEFTILEKNDGGSKLQGVKFRREIKINDPKFQENFSTILALQFNLHDKTVTLTVEEVTSDKKGYATDMLMANESVHQNTLLTEGTSITKALDDQDDRELDDQGDREEGDVVERLKALVPEVFQEIFRDAILCDMKEKVPEYQQAIDYAQRVFPAMVAFDIVGKTRVLNEEKLNAVANPSRWIQWKSILIKGTIVLGAVALLGYLYTRESNVDGVVSQHSLLGVNDVDRTWLASLKSFASSDVSAPDILKDVENFFNYLTVRGASKHQCLNYSKYSQILRSYKPNDVHWFVDDEGYQLNFSTDFISTFCYGYRSWLKQEGSNLDMQSYLEYIRESLWEGLGSFNEVDAADVLMSSKDKGHMTQEIKSNLVDLYRMMTLSNDRMMTLSNANESQPIENLIFAQAVSPPPPLAARESNASWSWSDFSCPPPLIPIFIYLAAKVKPTLMAGVHTVENAVRNIVTDRNVQKGVMCALLTVIATQIVSQMGEGITPSQDGGEGLSSCFAPPNSTEEQVVFNDFDMCNNSTLG